MVSGGFKELLFVYYFFELVFALFYDIFVLFYDISFSIISKPPSFLFPCFFFYLMFADSIPSNLPKDGDVYLTKRKEAYRKYEM